MTWLTRVASDASLSAGFAQALAFLWPGANLNLVNSVLDPPTTSNSFGLRINDGATVTAYDNRLVRPGTGAAIRVGTATYTWSELATGCGGLGAACVAASGNTEGDPGMVDAPAGDYRLLDSAFCIDAGRATTPWLDAEAAAEDLLGTPRDTTVDCGPTEWVPGQF